MVAQKWTVISAKLTGHERKRRSSDLKFRIQMAIVLLLLCNLNVHGCLEYSQIESDSKRHKEMHEIQMNNWKNKSASLFISQNGRVSSMIIMRFLIFATIIMIQVKFWECLTYQRTYMKWKFLKCENRHNSHSKKLPFWRFKNKHYL